MQQRGTPDGKGFLQSLRTVIDPKGKSAVVFGAGGAARACAVEMALQGLTTLHIVNRNPERGQVLVDLINRATSTKAVYVPWIDEYAVPDQTDIVVNATSIGLFPDLDALLSVKIESLLPTMVVADIIPNPPRTRFVREAETRGCKVIDGLGMLVNQGVISIKYWTGVDVDASVMRKKVEAIFGV